MPTIGPDQKPGSQRYVFLAALAARPRQAASDLHTNILSLKLTQTAMSEVPAENIQARCERAGMQP
jgi:hypothetical protein